MKAGLMIKKPGFLKPTLIFSAVGFFIPGFTAIGLLGFQMLLTSIGLDRPNSWKVLWTVAVSGALILPVLFFRHIRTLTKKKLKNLKTSLALFNLFEYTFIQASLALFFTSGQILCFVTDGQNGLELIFTAWMAIPILIGFSILFRQSMKFENEEN